MISHIARLLIVVPALLLVVGAPARAHSNAEQIRELGAEWVAAVAAGDIEAIANIYTPDAVFMPPNAPQSEGREAIGEAWRGLLALPGFALTFGATRIEVSASGDLAYDVGAYWFGFNTDAGRVNDEGKYVVVWKKLGGKWKAAADIFNSNLPGQ